MTNYIIRRTILPNDERMAKDKMHKSVYSVLLSDELVARLDEEAYKNGVSRSVMLDRLLADYLTVETVDMKIENALINMGKLIERCSGLRFTNLPSNSMAFVQGALLYKYNPTVKYSVELFPAGDLGQLKISLRTTSETLLSLMENFYTFFISLEKKYIGEKVYGYADNKFVRVFSRPDGLTPQRAGEAIAEYVAEFDKYLRIYFSHLSDYEKARYETEKEYRKNIEKKEVIL